MKITKEIIQRIEGEATLELEWENSKIKFAKIKFLNYRAIEEILKGRAFLDSLMVTPRVCGICSHSHALCCVDAIEDAYKNIGVDLTITSKAKKIREVALITEKIQNHLKWFYFTILPELFKINGEKFISSEPFLDKEWFEAQKAIKNILKLSSIFCGQWPHGSFVMPGGVTCDPINSDIISAKSCLSEVENFLEEYLFNMPLVEFVELKNLSDILDSNSTFDRAVSFMKEKGFGFIGKSYDRFITLGNDNPKKAIRTTIYNADLKYVKESLKNSFFDSRDKGYTYSKSALYKESFYETGPLARAIIEKDPLLRDCHRKCKDSTISRVIARVKEIATLTLKLKIILDSINLSEHSMNTPKFFPKDVTSEGQGAVEASRGSLIHKIVIKKGKIDLYDIITPTVWNLGNGTYENPSTAQKAIIGLEDTLIADFVFKSFDVCSVCTTQ